MYECRNFARIVALNGGLDKLAERPITIDMAGFDTLFIEHRGVGIHGDPTQLVSVALLAEKDGDLLTHPEMIFEVIPSADRKIGWRSGTWLPVGFYNAFYGYHHNAVFLRDGKVVIRSLLVSELRSYARTWNRSTKEQKYVDAFEWDLANDPSRRIADRVEAERVKIARARDERGRWLKRA